MTTPTDPRTTQSYVPHGNVPPIWAGTQPQPTLPDPGIPEKQPDKRNWFARHKVLSGLGAAFLLFVGVGVAAGGGDGGGGATVDPAASAVARSMPPVPSEQKEANASASNAPKAPPAPTAAPTVQPKPAVPALTTAQENAIGSARDYLTMSGFSRRGLIEQLSSQYGDGYSKADATFAVDYLHVNWKEQAVRSAKAYLALDHFSRSGLIQQLSSAYGDGYTRAEATYAADKVGL